MAPQQRIRGMKHRTQTPLTKRDVLGPGVLMNREYDIIYALRDALKRIAEVEPQQANSLAWSLVLIARDPLIK